MSTSVEAPAIPGIPAGKVGVWWFLASEIMMFGGLIASYIVFRLGGSGWHEASAHVSVTLGAVNTLILLTSSLTVVQAFAAAERENAPALRLFLGLTILGGLAFLVSRVAQALAEEA